MKPWDVRFTNKKPSDAFLIPLWKDFLPKDFYFTAAAKERDNKRRYTKIYVVPIGYFDLTSCMYFDSLPIINILPIYIEEVSDCIYETYYNPEYVINHMEELGFVRNIYFDNFVVKKNL